MSVRSEALHITRNFAANGWLACGLGVIGPGECDQWLWPAVCRVARYNRTTFFLSFFCPRPRCSWLNHAQAKPRKGKGRGNEVGSWGGWSFARLEFQCISRSLPLAQAPEWALPWRFYMCSLTHRRDQRCIRRVLGFVLLCLLLGSRVPTRYAGKEVRRAAQSIERRHRTAQGILTCSLIES